MVPSLRFEAPRPSPRFDATRLRNAFAAFVSDPLAWHEPPRRGRGFVGGPERAEGRLSRAPRHADHCLLPTAYLGGPLANSDTCVANRLPLRTARRWRPPERRTPTSCRAIPR